jgi:hypothetical protein
MNGENQENLRELFGRFFDPEEAARAAEDVRRAEQILHENPAPQPDERLIANIRFKIEEALAVRRRARAHWSVAYRVAVAAAVIIIVSIIGTTVFERAERPSGEVQIASIIPTALWESQDITADDAELVILTAEVEQIQNEVLTLQHGGARTNGERAFVELEMEFVEVDSDFWKG